MNEDFYKGIEHEITVGKLKELLAQLQDDDVLVPNQVRNLAIFRGNEQIGFIDLLTGSQEVELYSEV